MAAADPVKDLKERATCPICRELFLDPVMTECGHSFCRECIARHCQGDGDVACPQCNEKLRKGNLRPNRELRSMVESLPPLLRSQTGGEPRQGDMCERHQEPLQLYCKADQSPICVFCERSQAHRGHTVVLVEEAVQEHWETLTKHLAGMESTYGRLHPLVSMDRKHLSPSAGEEAHEKLKRLADNVVTLFKVHTEGPGQRFADAASQTQPRDPDWRGVSPGREAAGETESQGPAGREPGSEREHGRRQASLDPTIHTISDTTEAAQSKVAVKGLVSRCDSPTSPAPSGGHTGREPGSEPASERQEETRSHVVHVCEEAPTPKYGLDQTTLDPTVHTISSTTGAVQSKVDVKSVVSRFDSPTSPAPWQVSVGDQAGVSPAGQGVTQTESGGDTGRGGRESQEQKGAAGVPTKAKPPPVPLKRQNTLPPSWKQQQADAPSRSDSLQGLILAGAALGPGGSGQVGVSPGGRVARPPDIQGCAVEVTLDPATAHPRLVLSEDRKSAERGDTRQDLPNNPERFDTSVCVLGSEGFTSGRRYWEVEVGPRGGWAIGVARDSVQRKGGIQPKPDLGIWALDSYDVSQVPRKVGVYLDYEGGEVRFYNAENMALISSLTATFTGRLVPFFHLRAVGSRLSLSPRQR